MSATTYEIRLSGHLAPQVAAELGRSTRVVDVPPETVLRTAHIDPAGVHALIDRLGDFGLELLELRQCADADLWTYELRVRGSLGPLLLSAIPHAAAARVSEHTVLVTAGSDELDLLEIVRPIVAVGVEVQSVRRMSA